MQDLSPYLIPVVIGFGLLGVVLVLVVNYGLARGTQPAVRRRNGARQGGAHHGGALEVECPNCQRTMVFDRKELSQLTGAELALVVSATPRAQGRKLADYNCPYCEANHCFAIDVRPPELIITNAFTPQGKSSHCSNCQKKLKRPPWAAGTYDQRLTDAPQRDPQFGLVCSRCDAVCCMECCENVTKNRTKDGSYLCPRCYRGPVDRFYHF